MLKQLVARLRRRLAAEDGAALIMSVGMSAGLLIAGTTVIDVTAANQRSTGRSEADQKAYALAEAGLNNAFAVVANPANSPADSTLLPPRTTPYTTGSATWSGAYDRANAVWTLSSTGTTRNPAVAGNDRTKTMSARVRVTPVHTSPLANDAWNYLYTRQASVGGTCDVSLSANVTVTSPLFVSGNLCLSSRAAVAAGPLVVKNRVNLLAVDATIGTPAARIGEAHVGYGCKYASLPWHPDLTSPFCSDVDHVYVVPGKLDQTIPDVQPPTVLWDTWFRNAAPGPFEPCTASSGLVPVFENETLAPARNASVPGSFSLTPLSAYSCRVGPADRPLGELSWDPVTRTLTVNGTIFLDGSAKVDNGQVNRYAGRGTLYLSGTFLVSTGSKLCAVVAGTDCDFAAWDPRAADASILTVAANGSGGQLPLGMSVQVGSSSSYQGMLYATSIVQLGSGAQTQGGMVAWTIFFGSGTRTYPFPELESAPTGTPGTQHSFAYANAPEDFSD